MQKSNFGDFVKMRQLIQTINKKLRKRIICQVRKNESHFLPFHKQITTIKYLIL